MLVGKLRLFALTVVAASVFGAIGPKTAVAANQFVVDYRVTKWKTSHFDDAKGADVHYATLKKLGCEVKKGSHAGHYDVSYVCPKWRRIALKTHDEAHEWEKWLKANGFSTKHKH